VNIHSAIIGQLSHSRLAALRQANGSAVNSYFIASLPIALTCGDVASREWSPKSSRASFWRVVPSRAPPAEGRACRVLCVN